MHGRYDVGRTFVEGEFLDTVCGIAGSRTEIVNRATAGGECPGYGARRY